MITICDTISILVLTLFIRLCRYTVLQMLVKPMRKGVTVTILMDCCHSGKILDFPYQFSSGDTRMSLDRGAMQLMLGKIDVAPFVCCAPSILNLVSININIGGG